MNTRVIGAMMAAAILAAGCGGGWSQKRLDTSTPELAKSSFQQVMKSLATKRQAQLAAAVQVLCGSVTNDTASVDALLHGRTAAEVVGKARESGTIERFSAAAMADLRLLSKVEKAMQNRDGITP